jgi:hypothetical protein
MEVKEVGLPSFTLSEAVQYVIVLKRAKNLKEHTVKDYLINMQYFIEWVIERRLITVLVRAGEDIKCNTESKWR